MTKGEALQLFNSLNTLGELKGVKFSYGVTKNIKNLQSEVEALQKALEPSAVVQEFEKARVELAKQFAKVDENGKPVIKNNQYELADQAAFDKAMAALKEEKKEAFEARTKQIEEYNELLGTETAIELFKIKLEDVPQEISVAQMNGIAAVIEE